MKSPLVDFDHVADQSLFARFAAQMWFFPQCCSTGIITNVSAQKVVAKSCPVMTGSAPYLPDPSLVSSIARSTTIWTLMRAVQHVPYFVFPQEVGHWFLMSLCLRKKETGKDDSQDGAYGGFKCAQITMFDRLLEDKDPAKGFKFTYNMNYSVDQFQEWLSEQGGAFGEVYLSPPVPGAHGARVRGCVFTPDLEALQRFEAERFPILKEHVNINLAFLNSKKSLVQKVTDATAKLW